MDSGLAAIIGAAIGSGSTLIVSLAVPIVSGTIGARRRAERERREAIRVLFPTVVRSILEMKTMEDLAVIPTIQLLLKTDEWAIGRFPLIAAGLEPKSPELATAVAAMNEAVAGWLRKEISPEQARRYFVKRTGLAVERVVYVS